MINSDIGGRSMVGKKLYYIRKLKGLTQTELARGICSISYLSKIENGHEIPSQDIVMQLCQRLGVTINELDSSAELRDFENELLIWYHAVNSRDKEAAKQHYIKLNEHVSLIQHPKATLKYKIFLVNYLLLMRDIQEAKKVLNELQLVRDKLDEELEYYYLFFSGLFAYYVENYYESLQLCMQAEIVKNREKIDDNEVYYHIALVNMHLHRTFQSIKYAEKALQWYTKKSHYIQLIDSQIILGINLTRMHDFSQADKHLKSALNIAKKLNSHDLMNVSYHNLGYLSYQKKQFDEAINYFKKSLQLCDQQYYDHQIKTFYNLARTYCEMDNYVETIKYVDLGSKLAEKHNIKEFILHFKYLNLFINAEHSKIEPLLKNEVIPYFEKKKSWNYVIMYAEKLADYYVEQKKYKYSSHYYSLVNVARQKMYSYLD